jgi:hypothetical protein
MFLLKESAFVAIHSGCFHGFDSLKTTEMADPSHLTLTMAK